MGTRSIGGKKRLKKQKKQLDFQHIQLLSAAAQDETISEYIAFIVSYYLYM